MNSIYKNLLLWCDDKISFLKRHNIKFQSGVAIIPPECIYTDIPRMVSTYQYRSDIPADLKAKSLLTYFTPDSGLWNRLFKIEDEIPTLLEYGGIAGFDLSPSLGMLRPRQKFSITINSVFNCYCALHGVKILPNARLGDMSTMSMSASIPDGVNFISSRLGCKRNGFKAFGRYQVKLLLQQIRPRILFIYGRVSLDEACDPINRYGIDIVCYPDRRSRVRNNAEIYAIVKRSHNKIVKIPFGEYLQGVQ
ncbi:hypothetical protein IJT93_00525 [bacterium]|nr:hypothetical protein [bacterium]